MMETTRQIHFAHRLLLGLTLLLAFLPVPVNGQDESDPSDELPSVSEIVEKYIEAAGGEMTLLSVESIHYQSSIEHLQGSQTWKTIEVYWKEKNWVTTYHRQDGTTLVVGSWDGRIWRSNRGSEPHWMDDADALTYKFFNPDPTVALSWRDFDGEITVEGIDTLDDDRKAYKLKFDYAAGTSITRWFDVDTGLVAQIRYPISGTYSISTQSDYRTVDGLVTSFFESSQYPEAGIELESTMEKFEVNPKFDDSKVAVPESLAEASDK